MSRVARKSSGAAGGAASAAALGCVAPACAPGVSAVGLADENGASFVPDPFLREVDMSQPKLDVSAAAPGGDQELWLLQLPQEFPTGASVEWQITEDAVDGFRGRCQVQGVEYLLVPDQQALSADLYATPAHPHGKLVPLVRRMTVVRCTQAPMMCFGQSEEEAKAAGSTAPGAPSKTAASPADHAAVKKRRTEQQQPVPAPVAPAVPAPRGGAGPAAPSKTGLAAPGAEGPRDAGAAAPAAAGEQHVGAAAGKQGQEGTAKKNKKDKEKEKGEKSEKRSEKKKRKSEAAQGAAADASPAAAAAAAGDTGGGERSEKRKKKKKDKS